MDTVSQAFSRACSLSADRPALESDDLCLTYAQLDAWSNAVAAQLVRRFGPDLDRIALMMRRSPAFVATVLAVLKLKAAYVPIDPDWPSERIALILDETEAALALDAEFARRGYEGCVVGAHPTFEATCPEARREADANTPAYLMYTSGSTGVPKAVIIPHRGILRLVIDADFADIAPDDRWALMSSVAFDASTLELWAPLLNGGTCVVYPDGVTVDGVAGFLSGRRITSCFLTAGLFNLMVDYRLDALGGLKHVLTGGDTESKPLMARFVSAHPQVRLIHAYGPTENTTFTLCHPVTTTDVASSARIPIGTPIRGTTVRIVTEQGDDAQIGEPGELWAGGAGVGLGYFRRPELSAQRFVSHAGGLWYRTGDIVRRRAEGVIEFVGRLDRQVKIQGHRIELEEVEKALSECPGVQLAGVIVQGESADTKRLVAGFTGEATGERIREQLRSMLPAYAIPAVIRRLDSIPLTTTGKIDRTVLQQALSGSSDAIASGGPTDRREARGTLLRIWRDLLGDVPDADDADFVRLGGHSLLIIRLIAEVRRVMGVEVLPSQVYNAPTLAAMTSLVQRQTVCGSDTTARAPVEQCALSEKLIYVASAVDAANSPATYNEYLGFHFDEPIDLQRLSAALAHCVRTHPVLRSNYRLESSRLVRSLRAMPVPSDLVRVEAPIDSVDSVCSPAGRRAIDEPFDLARDLLIRAHAFPVRAGGMLLILSLHHIVIDEWSIDLLLRTLSEAYAKEAGDEVSAEDASWDFGLLVAYEQANADMNRAEAVGREFARTQARTVGGHAGPMLEAVVPVDEAAGAAVRDEARRQGVSEMVVWLAIYGTVLSAPDSDAGPWIVTPISMRRDSRLSGLVGYAIDLRLVQVPVSESLPSTIRATGRVLAQELDRVSVPFDAVVRAAASMRSDGLMATHRPAFVYRPSTHPGFVLGPSRGRPVWISRAASRFGLCVGVERVGEAYCLRVEASSERFDLNAVTQIGSRMLDAARGLSTGTRAGSVATSARTAGESALAGPEGLPVTSDGEPLTTAEATELQTIVSELWMKMLGTTRSPAGTASFFACGGTSLDLLRLTAEIQRATGQQLDIARFLQLPTFDQLLTSLHFPRQSDTVRFAEFGRSDAPMTLLVLPGGGGTPLTFHRLWQELDHRSPDRWHVVCLDMKQVEQHFGLDAIVSESVRRLSTANGRLSIFAYSAGGPIAVEVASRMPPDRPVEYLWLVDVFATRHMFVSKGQRLRHALKLVARDPAVLMDKVVRRVRRVVGRHFGTPVDVSRTTLSNYRLYRELRNWRETPCSTPFTLIRAAGHGTVLGVDQVDELHGLGEFMTGPRRVCAIDAEHHRIIREHPDRLAQIILEDAQRLEALAR